MFISQWYNSLKTSVIFSFLHFHLHHNPSRSNMLGAKNFRFRHWPILAVGIRGGMFKWTSGGSKSSMVNPLSAIITIPVWMGMIPSCMVICLSEVRPPQSRETKFTVPLGVTPINSFSVLWCLYSLQVCHWATWEEDFSMNISVQSRTTCVFAKSMKARSKLNRICSVLSQGTSFFEAS